MRFVLLLACASVCPAALHHIYVDERTDVLQGRSFGSAGPYERITGRVHFAVDPALPANTGIAGLDRAPRNGAGLVEFSADFHMLKPRDPSKGNGTILFEVVNRGAKLLLATFNFARGSKDPMSDQAFGDKFLLEQGYTVVWLGWQFDVPSDPGLMRLYAPRVGGITGLVRAEHIPSVPQDLLPLSERNHIPYPVADRNSGALTVRDRFNGPRQNIARANWTWADGAIGVKGGMQPGRIYEFIYTAKDPAVAGLGFAGVRDLIAYLKYDGGPMLLGDQRRFLKRAIGTGVSQSGRFLRTMVYEGFNADEKGRRVFDGIWPQVAGAGRGSFNMLFAQPSRDAQPFGNFFYPTDVFPFTDTEQTDPMTGEKDSLLGRAVEQKVVPKIFYTDGAYEYWGRATSLAHTAPLGTDSRRYHLTGAQHGTGSFPPVREGSKYPQNVLDQRYVFRALLVAMNDWLRDGREPPASAYPSPRELTSPAELKFPAVPGVTPPARAHTAWHVDRNAEPPVVGEPWDAQIPTVDRDGNEVAGVRMPELVHPLGTYTGWNFRTEAHGAPDEAAAYLGSFFAFAPTAAARGEDPRPSIAERYSGRAEYVSRIGAAARSLADRRLLLDRDVAALEDRAGAMWDALAK